MFQYSVSTSIDGGEGMAVSAGVCSLVVWKLRQWAGDSRSDLKCVMKEALLAISPRSISDQAPLGAEARIAWLM